MWKKLLGVALMLVLGTGILLADESKGKVKKYEKGTVTVTVGTSDVEYKLRGAKVYDGTTEITDKKERRKFLADLKEGTEVTVVYTKDGDKITVSEFKVKK